MIGNHIDGYNEPGVGTAREPVVGKIHFTFRSGDFWQEECKWKDKELRVLNKRLLKAEDKLHEEKTMELKDIKAEKRKLEESERQMHEKIEALNGLIAARESHKRTKASLYTTQEAAEETNWKNDN